jgi:hypothetical protein
VAWLLEHGDGCVQPPAVTSAVAGRTIGGHSAGDLTRNVLDNITLYWLTDTGVSAGRL